MNPPSITPDLQASLRQAIEEARKRRHEYLTLEHLLLALLDNPSASRMLEGLGVDREALRQGLESFLGEALEQLPPGATRTPEETPGIQRVLQRAAFHAISSERTQIDAPSIVIARHVPLPNRFDTADATCPATIPPSAPPKPRSISRAVRNGKAESPRSTDVSDCSSSRDCCAMRSR